MSAGAYSTRDLHGDQSSSIVVPMCSLSAKCTSTKSPKYANFQRKWKELDPAGLTVDKWLAGSAGGEELCLLEWLVPSDAPVSHVISQESKCNLLNIAPFSRNILYGSSTAFSVQNILTQVQIIFPRCLMSKAQYKMHS